MSGSWLRERVARSEPPVGGLQLHELTDPPVNYFCPRCGWRGYVWNVATVDGDWTEPVCESCHEDLHPGIEVVVSYWSVTRPSYLPRTPEERLPFTVIRSRKIAGHLGGRDEMYRPHFSQDRDVWEFTSVLVEEPGTAAATTSMRSARRRLARSWSARGPSTSPEPAAQEIPSGGLAGYRRAGTRTGR